MNHANSPDQPLTLTERLAADRTRMASERTFLSYVRTALGLVVTGTGFSEYLDSPLLRVIFILFIPTGIVVLGIGVASFRKRKKTLDRYIQEP